MTQYIKVLWCDSESTGLDTKVSNILDLAWMIEIDGEVQSKNQFFVQPIFHSEDKVYGNVSIEKFVGNYNKGRMVAAPEYLRSFSFGNDCPPLFAYSTGSLTFNLEPPAIHDPAEWILDTKFQMAQKVLETLIEDLDSWDHIKKRWILAGHNVKYDYDLICSWAERILGKEEAYQRLIRKINSFVFMDTMTLARWFQYKRSLPEGTAKLSDIAKMLDINVEGAHTALADVLMSREIANRLFEGLTKQPERAKEA